MIVRRIAFDGYYLRLCTSSVFFGERLLLPGARRLQQCCYLFEAIGAAARRRAEDRIHNSVLIRREAR